MSELSFCCKVTDADESDRLKSNLPAAPKREHGHNLFKGLFIPCGALLIRQYSYAMSHINQSLSAGMQCNLLLGHCSSAGI